MKTKNLSNFKKGLVKLFIVIIMFFATQTILTQKSVASMSQETNCKVSIVDEQITNSPHQGYEPTTTETKVLYFFIGVVFSIIFDTVVEEINDRKTED